MKNLLVPTLLGLFILFVLSSCSSNDAVVSTPIKTRKTYPLVDKKLWTYFEKFEDEFQYHGGVCHGSELLTKSVEKICKQPSSSVGRAAVRCSEGPGSSPGLAAHFSHPPCDTTQRVVFTNLTC